MLCNVLKMTIKMSQLDPREQVYLSQIINDVFYGIVLKSSLSELTR
jgi:hypothetical protein